MVGEDDDYIECASPPCFVNEVDPTYFGSPPPAPSQPHANVQRWRRFERDRLIKERLEIGVDARHRLSECIVARLDDAIGDLSGKLVSAYWPFRGEPDLRDWLERIAAHGGRYALPVVIRKNAPLVFRTWRKGEPLSHGVWNIPVPTDGEVVYPDVVIAPLVGYDRAGYRLGYGGGFFDRTLAAMPNRPLVIGVGYSQAMIPSINPQVHDIPMNKIVTEQETFIAQAKASQGHG